MEGYAREHCHAGSPLPQHHTTPPTPHPQVAELAVQFFITNDKPNVAGLVLAGSADFKTELSQSDMFDPRLQAVVLGVVDVSYGGLVGWGPQGGGRGASRRSVKRRKGGEGP